MKNNETQDLTASKLDAIKDIIFGHDIAEIQKEFNSVKDSIAKLKHKSESDDKILLENLTQSINNLENSLNARLDSMEKSIFKKLDALNEAKTDRNKLGQMFEKLGQGLRK